MATSNQDAGLSREYSVASVELQDGATALKPAKRGGATLTQVGEAGPVYLIGGANREGTSFGDVHRLDLGARRWTLVKPSSGSLPPRSGHSAVAIGAKIYVFGGLDAAAGDIYNDVYVFNTRTSSWSKPAIVGDLPLPRNAHAAVILPETEETASAQRMLVFGGSSPEYGATSDLYVLHIPSNETKSLYWEKLSTSSETPEARELHCGLLQSDNTVVFAGGRNFDGKVCTDMAILDYSTWTWQLVPICESNRCSLAAGVVDGELVSFGGWDGGRICNDCYRYSDDEESWLAVTAANAKDEKEPVDPSVEGVSERFGHCGTTVTMELPSEAAEKTRQQGLLVFGGMNAESDLDDLILIMPCLLSCT